MYVEAFNVLKSFENWTFCGELQILQGDIRPQKKLPQVTVVTFNYGRLKRSTFKGKFLQVIPQRSLPLQPAPPPARLSPSLFPLVPPPPPPAAASSGTPRRSVFCLFIAFVHPLAPLNPSSCLRPSSTRQSRRRRHRRPIHCGSPVVGPMGWLEGLW